MSGALVGLVWKHGPMNHNQRVVLAVIAEDQRGLLRHVKLTDAEIGGRALLGRTTTKAAIVALLADGWLGGRRGEHQGVCSRYILRLDNFPQEAADDVVKALSKGSPHDPSGNGEGSPHDPSEAERGRHTTLEGSPHDPPSVSVTTPSSGQALQPAPEASPWEAEDEELRTALGGLPTIPWKPALRAALGACLVDRGHTASAVNRYLRDHFHANAVGDPYAVVLSNLRAMPPAIAAVPQATGEKCAVCDKTETECRRREKISGHSFTPITRNGAASGGADEKRNGTGEPIADDDPWAVEKRKIAALFGS